MSFLSWIQHNVSALQSAASSASSWTQNPSGSTLSDASGRNASLIGGIDRRVSGVPSHGPNRVTGLGADPMSPVLRVRNRSKSDGSPSPPLYLPVNRSAGYGSANYVSPAAAVLRIKSGGVVGWRGPGICPGSPRRTLRKKPVLQHAATADLINRVQEADGGFFESFSALSWKRENRRLQAIREEEAKRECRPPLESAVGVDRPRYEITKKEWQRLYITVLYTINNQIGSRPTDRAPYVEDLYRYSQKAFGVSDDDHQRSISAALKEQPPIIVLNVTVIEASGLEAKDPNGFSDPFCMLGIQPAVGSGNGHLAPAFDNGEAEEEEESRLKKHHSFKLSFKRKEGGGGGGSKKADQCQSPGGQQLRVGVGGAGGGGVNAGFAAAGGIESGGIDGGGDGGFSNNIPARYICATSVKPHTLNPNWDEKFAFDIDDINTDMLHLDIWDNDDESSVFEAVRQLNQVQSWKGLGRYFKQIAQSARSHGSYSVDDFLGSVDVNLNDIPSKGLEGWFSLQGRSQRSSVQGDIKLRLTLTTRDRCPGPEHWWEVREHERMIHTFCEFEMLRQGEEVYRWTGRLPVEAETVLHQHAIQNDLSELQQIVCRWRAFSHKHMEKAFDYSVLFRLLQKLNQDWVIDSLAHDEEQSLADSLSHFVDFSLGLIFKQRDLFPPINRAAIYKLEYLLKCLRLISDMQAFWRCCPFHKEIHLEIMNAIKKGSQDWYERMYVLTKPQIKTDNSTIMGLIELVNIVNADLHRSIAYYDKLFETIMNVNYFYHVFKQMDKLLIEQLKKDWKWKIEEDVKSTVEKLCRRMRDSEDISDDPAAEGLVIGTAMFELYLSLQEFAKLRENLAPVERRGFQIVGFHEWFSGALLKWLSIARLKAMLRIRKAVELDRATQFDSGVKLSTSAVDTTACFYQIKDFWKQLAWSDMITAYPFVFKILDDICNGATYYGDLIHSKLQEVGYFDDDGQFDVTEQLCLTINNIEHVRSALKAIPEELGLTSILNAIEKVEGEMYAQQCRNAVSNMLKSSEEDVEEKILFVVRKVGMRSDIKKYVFHLAWAPDALPAENAINPLMEYLDNNLTTLNHTLLRTNFERILEVIWNIVLEELKNQAESGVGDKQTIYFHRLYDACNILLEFFHAEQKGLDIQRLHCPMYQNLDGILDLHRSDTKDLITKYYLSLIEEQRTVEKRDFGSLTVKVYFHHECLFIEILHARDVIALDPNGFSDPFVIIELNPHSLFPNSPQLQTKVHKKTLNPLFDECFEYAVTMDQCKCESSLVLFTVMDHDIMLSNDFAGEACVPLSIIPGVRNYLPASDIPRLQTMELNLTRPKFTDSIILNTLEKRVWEKGAQEFTKKRKSQIL